MDKNMDELLPEKLADLKQTWKEHLINQKPPSQLNSKQIFEKQIQIELDHFFQKIMTRFSASIDSLVQTYLLLNRKNSTHFPLSTLKDLIKKLSIPVTDSKLALKDYYQIPPETIEVIEEMVNFCIEQKNYAPASDILFFLAQMDPDNAQYFQTLGDVDYSSENYPEAIWAYSMALIDQITPDLHPLIGLAYCYEKQGEYQKAFDCINYALETIKEDDALQKEYQGQLEVYLQELRHHL